MKRKASDYSRNSFWVLLAQNSSHTDSSQVSEHYGQGDSDVYEHLWEHRPPAGEAAVLLAADPECQYVPGRKSDIELSYTVLVSWFS